MSQLLPPNRTALEAQIAASHPLDLPVPLRTLWNPRTCPAHLLPFLAWAFSVDHWSPDWPEQVKRDVIAASFDVHRIKGTRLAVDRALKAMGVDVEITEWFELDPPLPRGTFSAVLYVNNNLTPHESAFLNQRLYDELRAAIDAAKNVRSHYHLKVGARFDSGVGTAGVMSGMGALSRNDVEAVQPPLEIVAPVATGIVGQGVSLTRQGGNLTIDAEPRAVRTLIAGAYQAWSVIYRRMETVT